MSSKPNISDQDLFKAFVEQGRPESLFRELMGRYKQKVYWQVRRIVLIHADADEVVQNVFIKLWQNAEKFRFDSSVSSYIYRIAYNESLNLLKQNKRFQSLDDMIDQDGFYVQHLKAGIEINPHTIEAKLQSALLTLPEKQRLVFIYKYFDDLPYKEIADITGTSEGALKANYHFAVEKIKVFLERD